MANVLLGVYVLGLAPALLIGGRLSDRYGRRPLTVAAIAAAVLGGLLLAGGILGPVLLILGRIASGLAVGLAMAAGTSWVTELSHAPFDPRAAPSSGALRASTAFVAGSGSGALVAGALAQWGPLPEVLPFVLQAAIAAAVLLLLRAPETVATLASTAGAGPRRRGLAGAGEPRFTRVVVVAAPWLFAAAALAYGYLPTQTRSVTGATGSPSRRSSRWLLSAHRSSSSRLRDGGTLRIPPAASSSPCCC